MTNDKPELTSEELLRQARESFDLGEPSATPAMPPSADVSSTIPESPSWPAADPNETPITSDSLLSSDGPVMPPPATPDAGSAIAPPPSAIPEPPKAWAPSESALPPPLASPAASPPPPGPASPPPGGPASPPPPQRTPSASSGGIDYYAAGDDVAPQSYGSAGGTPAPPPGLGMNQPRQPRLSQPPMRKSRNIPWRLVIGGGIFAVLAIGGAIANRGTTSANSLDVGDCFVDPGFGDIERVDDQDCAEPHEVQIYAELKDVSAANLSTFAQGPQSAGARCEQEIIRILEQLEDLTVVIPDDVGLGMLTEADVSRSSDVMCTIESPSAGLVGSVLGDN